MKNLATSLILIVASILFTQCKDDKNMDNDLPQSKHTLVVESGEMIIHPITNAIPTEGGYRITKQAKNYNISEIKYNTVQAAISYQYQSKEGFKGTEIVEVTSSYSIGDANLIDDSVIILTIEVK